MAGADFTAGVGFRMPSPLRSSARARRDSNARTLHAEAPDGVAGIGGMCDIVTAGV